MLTIRMFISEVRHALVDAYREHIFVKVFFYVVLAALVTAVVFTKIRSVNGESSAWHDFFHVIIMITASAIILLLLFFAVYVAESISPTKPRRKPAKVRMTDLKELDDTSKDLLKSWDRSVLGRFGIQDFDVLHLMNMACLSYVIGQLDDNSYSQISYKLQRRLEQLHIDRSDVQYELYFWWQNSDDVKLQEYVETMRADEVLAERLRQFELIASHQDKHDYFEAGVWDINFIERCVADGIDPSLALTLAVHNA